MLWIPKICFLAAIPTLCLPTGLYPRGRVFFSMYSSIYDYFQHFRSKRCADPERRTGAGPPSPGKSQVAKGFLRNTGTGHLETKWDTFGTNDFRGRLVRPSVKKKVFSPNTHTHLYIVHPDGIFCISI